MDTRKLRLFLALADELNFGRAARRAGVTQSVLSVQIRRLEDELGAALFHRSTRDVRLTEAGAGLRPEAEAILSRIDQTRRVVRALADGSARLLRIGFTTPLGMADLPDIIAAFRRERPGVELVLTEMGTVDQEAALAAGDIDIGFLHPPVDQSGLCLHAIGRLYFGALRRRQKAIGGREARWAEVAAEPLIFYPRRRAPRLYDRMIAAAQAHGISPRIVGEAETFLSAITMARSGLGTALVPGVMRPLCGTGDEWREIDDSPLYLDNAIAFRESRSGDALIGLLRRILPPL